MTKISFTLEAITPVFLSGNDQNAVEFRAPSIRGQLRYWYRALLGGILTTYYPQPKKLAEEIQRREAEIFGTTDRGSQLLVRVREIHPRKETQLPRDKFIFIRYLGYGLETRKAFAPGQGFGVDISFWKSAAKFESVMAATLWAGINLGNVGARSRRGFGSLTFTNEVSLGGLTVKRPTSFEELTDQLRANLKSVLNIFEEHTRKKYGKLLSLPPLSVICPEYWKLMLIKTPYESWEDALNAIGRNLREFREDHNRGQQSRTTRSGKTFSYYVTKDYDAVKGFFDKSGPATPQGSIFGLPHQFQFGSTGDKVMIKGKDVDRRASPLYIRVYKAGQKYYVGLQVFKSRFLPGDLEFEDLNNKSHKGIVAAPLYHALDNFVSSFNDVEEINLW